MGKELSMDIRGEHIGIVFGQYDEHIKIIEKEYNVKIVNRGESVKIQGETKGVQKAKYVLSELNKMVQKGEEISIQTVNYLCDLSKKEEEVSLEEIYDDTVAVTRKGKAIKPKTFGQKKYIDAIKDNMVVFGVGPAGTGKTYLAMAMAITAFKKGEVNRIILTRPAIEAGEKLGFLPGDLQSKIDPYLRPLYDALYEIMGAESYTKNLEKGAIEIAPLAYMRGRTLDNSFIVLDEAQNTTPAQMKMFLTRLGFNTKAVITGDVTQIDLPQNSKSGLVESTKILSNVEGINICKLTNKDVVRHPLVQRIIKAYEKHEDKITKKSNKNYHKK